MIGVRLITPFPANRLLKGMNVFVSDMNWVTYLWEGVILNLGSFPEKLPGN